MQEATANNQLGKQRMQEAKARKPPKATKPKSHLRETGNAEDAKSQSRKSCINPTKSCKSQTERNSKDQRIKRPKDQGTKGPEDQKCKDEGTKTNRAEAKDNQRSEGPEDQGLQDRDQGTRRPRPGTKGPEEQGTEGPRDQRTKGPKDHGTRGVQGTRKSNANQKNRIYKQQSEIVGSFFLIAKKVFC